MASQERTIFSVDGDLRIVTANPAALRQWRKGLGDVKHRKLHEIFPGMVGTPVYMAMLRALKSFQPERFTSTSLVADGVVDVEIYPVNDGLQIVLNYPAGDRRAGKATRSSV